MKRNYFMLIGTLFLLLVVCENKMSEQKRIFRLMEKNSTGITILQINSNISFLDLTGEITLTKDEVEISLLNNENRAFYTIRFYTIDTFSVDGTLYANVGFRKIKYSSFDWLFALFLIVFAVRGSLGKPHLFLSNSSQNTRKF